MMEPLYKFYYWVVMPDGRTVRDDTSAHSPWHAIDKAYTLHQEEQPDRSKYRAKRLTNIVVQ